MSTQKNENRLSSVAHSASIQPSINSALSNSKRKVHFTLENPPSARLKRSVPDDDKVSNSPQRTRFRSNQQSEYSKTSTSTLLERNNTPHPNNAELHYPDFVDNSGENSIINSTNLEENPQHLLNQQINSPKTHYSKLPKTDFIDSMTHTPKSILKPSPIVRKMTRSYSKHKENLNLPPIKKKSVSFGSPLISLTVERHEYPWPKPEPQQLPQRKSKPLLTMHDLQKNKPRPSKKNKKKRQKRFKKKKKGRR